MRVTTGWCILSLLTIVGLLYTHGQVRLVHQSYVLNDRLERRDALHEQCTYLEYEVMRLKVPNRLKERLTSYHVELKTPKATETIAPVTPIAGRSARRWVPPWFRPLEAEATSE